VGPLLRLRRRWSLCRGYTGGGASAEAAQEVGPLHFTGGAYLHRGCIAADQNIYCAKKKKKKKKPF